jgi:hypothetical protein
MRQGNLMLGKLFPSKRVVVPWMQLTLGFSPLAPTFLRADLGARVAIMVAT